MRGNRIVIPIDKGQYGSIPACAGEPVCPPCSAMLMRVYPRVCGGTPDLCDGKLPAAGLSPRVRGNPGNGKTDTTQNRSIPACAGEPHVGRVAIDVRRVYPRVCGGTKCRHFWTMSASGLSPRVRGNLWRYMPVETWTGSIPACAGNPIDGDHGPAVGWSIPACAGEPRSAR